jgi:hypothetical protein
MSHFKVGDRVVVANPDNASKSFGVKIGTAGILVAVHGRVCDVRYHEPELYNDCESVAESFYSTELELEEIYNSPLYKMLEEEE